MESAATNSPRMSSTRAATATTKNVAPPWTQIVRGGSGESDEISSSAAPIKSLEKPVPSPTPPSLSEEECSVVAVEGSDADINNVSKKPAWNKPSNGASVAAASVEAAPPVMGGDSSWPALSEATKFPQKISSPDFSKNTVSDRSSVPVLQVSGAISSQKQVNSNANSNQNHGYPRQKSIKRHGGHTSSANGAVPQVASPAGAVVESPNLNSPNAHKNPNWESGQKGGPGQSSHNDHPQPRNSYRRGSGGPHPRGDGSYNHGHGGRRDDRVNRDWLPQQRSFNSREARVQPPGPGPRPFIRTPPPPPPPPPPPHGTAQFMVHGPPRGPFVSGYPEFPVISYYTIPSPDSIRGPFSVLMPSQMYVPVPDHQLHVKLINQIDYYFSNDNLIKDTFLRANMDEQGWVPITLIAGFKRVKNLTENISLILSAVQSSSVVEVQGEKVRKRNDWMRWVMQQPPQVPSNSGNQASGMSSNDVLAAHFQTVTLDSSEDHVGGSFQGGVQSEVLPRRSSSGESNNQAQLDVVAQFNVQSGYDASVSARSSSNIDAC